MVESLLAAGFDGVEWTPAHADTLCGPSLAFASQQDLVTGGEQAIATTFRHLEQAHAAGIAIVNLLTGPNLWEGADPRTDQSAVDDALFALERIVERAQQLSVRVALEPCWGTLAHDAATARAVLARAPVEIVMDPSHYVMTGDDIPGLVREWAGRIAHVHLKDAFGRPGMDGVDFHFCLLGEGHVPWPGFFAALDEIGYEGAMSVEFESYRYYEHVLRSDPAAAAALARQQVSALLEVV